MLLEKEPTLASSKAKLDGNRLFTKFLTLPLNTTPGLQPKTASSSNCLTQVEGVPARLRATNLGGPMTQKTRVLVLDDDEDDLFITAGAIEDIEDCQYDIRTTTCPIEATRLIQEEKADIVLCDFLMGKITGIEFIEEQRGEGYDIPIILLTGMNDRTTDEAALQAGASDFLSKSNLQPDLVDRSIRYAIANCERQRLFQNILENINAGVALLGSDLKPTLFNPEFVAKAEYATGETSEDAISAFCQKIMAESRIIKIRDRVFERKVSYTSAKEIVLLLHDVTEHFEALRQREEAKNKAAHLAMNCSLTDLPNRNSFGERIQSEIAAAEKEGRQFFLINLDLNKFKEVNDIHGHKIGDQLLREVSNRFKNCCQEGDFIARLGGDEFIAIQHNDDSDPNTLPRLATELLQAANEPIDIEGLRLQVGVSIGVSVFPEHGSTAEELMSNADTAMYRAKQDSINGGIHAFDEEMDRKIRETRLLSQELCKTIENGQIDVHFQPQADVQTGETTGFEALARWHHPDRGFVSPSMFIPLAEERGLIATLGESVLRKACAIAANWPKDISVAVNVSPVQIRDTDLVSIVHDVLLQTGFSPNRLELEVTESVLIEDKLRALHILRGIKNLGITIALDDFGTGFSSLSTLIAFPFDKIKIDRSFVEDCNRSDQAALVTRTIIKMGIQMGCKIVAEGVQKPAHIDFLKREGCQYMQGYLLGKPCPADEIDLFLPTPEFEEKILQIA